MAAVKAVVEQILEDTLGLGHLLKKTECLYRWSPGGFRGQIHVRFLVNPWRLPVYLRGVYRLG